MLTIIYILPPVLISDEFISSVRLRDTYAESARPSP